MTVISWRQMGHRACVVVQLKQVQRWQQGMYKYDAGSSKHILHRGVFSVDSLSTVSN